MYFSIVSFFAKKIDLGTFAILFHSLMVIVNTNNHFKKFYHKKSQY